MELVKDLVVTNVTAVKVGKYGGFLITLNCYEKIDPIAGMDTLYFVTLSLTSPALASLYDQLEITDDLGHKIPGQRVRLPSGIRINVACAEIKTDPMNKRLKYVKNVISIELVEIIRVDIDITFPAKEIIFHDWGIILQTKDGVYIQDKYVFFNKDMAFKSSSMMETIKQHAPDDFVHLRGKAKVFYSTYKEKTRWNVKSKHRFDSRFDEMKFFEITFNLDTIKTAYIKKLQLIRSNPSFKSLISKIGKMWQKHFVSESEILEIGKKHGIELDPLLVSMTFLPDISLDRYMYMKSLLTDINEIYYYQKSDDFKYVLLHDMASRKSDDYGQVAEKQKLIVIDVMMKKIYVFSCKEAKVLELSTEIVASDTILFIDRLIEKNGDFQLIDSVEVQDGMTLDEWFEPVANALFNT